MKEYFARQTRFTPEAREGSLSFWYKGMKIHQDDTPEDLELQDGDVIRVVCRLLLEVKGPGPVREHLRHAKNRAHSRCYINRFPRA